MNAYFQLCPCCYLLLRIRYKKRTVSRLEISPKVHGVGKHSSISRQSIEKEQWECGLLPCIVQCVLHWRQCSIIDGTDGSPTVTVLRMYMDNDNMYMCNLLHAYMRIYMCNLLHAYKLNKTIIIYALCLCS